MTEEEAHEKEIRDLKELSYIRSGADGGLHRQALEKAVRKVAASPRCQEESISAKDILKWIDDAGRYL